MKSIFLFSVLILISLCSFQCRSGSNENIDENKLKEKMVEVNKSIVKTEEQQIEEFISRHGWNMDSTGTGLRFMIYEKGTGRKPKVNEMVRISCKIFLLDATLCYEYKKDEPLEFVIGNKDVPRGIEEAVLLMRVGDKAKIIVPSHLGYGLLGDKNKIPGNSSLYVELELMEVL
jgi:FKBP-type peptidyl-prolyl cis-trans isomerase